MTISKTRLRKEIDKFNRMNKNQINPNRYFIGYEDALRFVLRLIEKDD